MQWGRGWCWSISVCRQRELCNMNNSVERFIEIYGACNDNLDEDTWLCWMGIWQIAWQEAQIGQSELIDVCKEIIKEPYSDSDPTSLLKTLKTRAELALNQFHL